jgi:hypothetical protein
MADESKNPGDAPTAATPPAGQQAATGPVSVQVQVDVSKMETVYANFVRLSLSSSTEEVVMDVGLHTGILTPVGMEPIQLTHRLVMNPFVAKRLLESLRQIVARHEQAFGVLEVDPQRRLRQR